MSSDNAGDERGKYRMTVSRMTVDKLGVKLYDKVSAVIAELVANGYDADAERIIIEAPMDTMLASLQRRRVRQWLHHHRQRFWPRNGSRCREPILPQGRRRAQERPEARRQDSSTQSPSDGTEGSRKASAVRNL